MVIYRNLFMVSKCTFNTFPYITNAVKHLRNIHMYMANKHIQRHYTRYHCCLKKQFQLKKFPEQDVRCILKGRMHL